MPAITHSDYVIRRALMREEEAIRALVRSERLNPHHLHFQNFAVAVAGGKFIGASQIRRHPDGSRELGSVVVARPWRGRGISAEIIAWLLDSEAETIHVITRRKHAEHYVRWGFAAIPPRMHPAPSA
jgi:amino-acid N-acetyltransferase